MALPSHDPSMPRAVWQEELSALMISCQSKFVVWTRLVPCRTSAGAAKCFDSMMLTYDGEHVFGNSSSSQPDKMVVWTLTQIHGVSSAVAIWGIRVTRTTSQSLHLYASDLQATVDVSIKENGVDRTVSAMKALWRQSTGLVNMCNVTRAPTSMSALPVPTYPVASSRYRSRQSPYLQLAQRKLAQCTTGSPAVQRTVIKSASVCSSTITV